MHDEYPRPQMVRERWLNLNGPWDFAIMAPSYGNETPPPEAFDRKIVAPFPVESKLSGICEAVPEGYVAWYRRSFTAPLGDRVLLHFGAVDWHAIVWVNGVNIGEHFGGFDPFSFDITAALRDGEQEVMVRVVDPTDAGTQPRGKQTRNPHGIFYTSTTGIWQTVWVEAVPDIAIEKIKLVPRIDHTTGNGTRGLLGVTVTPLGSYDGEPATAQLLVGDEVVAEATGVGELILQIRHPRLWSPEDPYLYPLVVRLGDDLVTSYAAFREVGLVKDEHGRTRIGLNGKPLFMAGPLDQGFWPDGLFTAPSDEALRYDIEITKRLGFNTIRKHVKVEPDRWYWMCDVLGMCVWQDMPSGDASIRPEDPDLVRTPESAAIFERELRAMIENLYNHPSIVCWVPFNEGWGQYDTLRITDLVRSLDSTRLIDATTGWSDRKTGDMHDWHAYPGPASPDPEPHRAAVLGEFGGLGFVVEGHRWNDKDWGYQTFQTAEELALRFEELWSQVRALLESHGLSAAIYTQTSDVESECNGLLTYDRSVIKIDVERVQRALEGLY